jgi:PAS domain S-box-containing protein
MKSPAQAPEHRPLNRLVATIFPRRADSEIGAPTARFTAAMRVFEIAGPLPSFGRSRRRFRRGLLTGVSLLALLLANRGRALTPTRDLTQYNCQTWSRQNGLPATGINAIAQTQDGHLWFGTAAGLLRFDGIQFKPLDLHPIAAVRNTSVTSLAAAPAGGLWVGLKFSGFGFYDGQSFSFRGGTNAATAQMDVRSVLEGRDGTLWLVAAQAAYRLNRSGGLEPVLATGSDTNATWSVTCGYEDPRGRLWFGTANHGVYCWQDGKITAIPDPKLNDTSVLAMAEDLEGQLWVGTSVGLFCYDASLQRKEIPPLYDEVRTLFVDRQGALWIGTSGRGLGCYRHETYDFLQRTDGLGSDYVNVIAEDNEGSLWVGTRNGVSQISDVKFPIQHAAEDPKVKDVIAVTRSRRDDIWITSGGGGAARFDPKTKTYTTLSGLTNAYAKRVFEAGNGDLYVVSGSRNLVVFSGDKPIATNVAPDLIVGLAEDEQGVVASVGGHLYRAGTNYFRPYAFTKAEPPPFYWIFNLATGRDGVIWVASVNGIFRVKDGAWQHWGTAEGLSDPGVYWICEDQDGVVWAGLLSGVARLKDNHIRLINRQDGLFDDNIYSIVPDDLGNLWMDSGRGIFRAARQGLNDFADGKTNRVACTVFDGINSVKVADKTDQERIGCKTADGRIWFPSPLGVVMVDPARIPVNRVTPPVGIDRVRANGKEVRTGAQTVVPPGEGDLEFVYSATTYITPQDVQFRYRLEGFDRDWVDAGGWRMAYYTNLKPGRYAFRVIAANSDGVWNETGTAINLELRPHYYQTAWFRLLCSGLALAAGIVIYRWRVRHLRRKHLALQRNRAWLETEVRNRTAELAESRNFLDRIVNSIGEPIFVKDRQHRGVLVNDAFCQLMACKREELIGKSDHDHARFRATGEADEFNAKDELVFTTGKENINEEKLTAADGTVHCLITKKSRYTDQHGGQFIVGIIRDITERKRAEEEIHRRAAVLEAHLNSTNEGILIVDEKGNKLVQNRRCAGLWGIPRHIVDNGDDKQQVEFVKNRTKDPEKFVEKVAYLYAHPDKISHDELEFKDGAILDRYSAPVIGKDGTHFGRIWAFRDITDSKRAEVKLRQSREEFKDLFDNAPVGFHEIDAEGRLIHINKTELKMLGYAAEELLGQFVWKISAEEETSRRAALAKLRGEPPPAEGFERRFRRKDGSTFPVWVQDRLLKGVDGTITGIRAAVEDITERQRVVDALRESQALFQSLVSQMHAGLFRKDGEGRFVAVNPAFCQLKGLRAEEILGKTPKELDDYERAKEAAGLLKQPSRQRMLAAQGTDHHERIMRTGEIIEVEEAYARPNGKVEYFHAVKTPVFDAKGRVIGSQGMQFDITERKRAAEAAAQEQARFKLVFDSMPVGIAYYIEQPNGQHTRIINDAHLKICGLTREQDRIPGIYRKITHPEDDARQQQLVAGLGPDRTGKYAMEKRYLRPDGQVVWVAFTFLGRKRPDGNFEQLTTVVDITERKRAEEQLRQLSSAVKHSPVSIVITDRDGNIEYVNPKFTAVTGYSSQEVIGRNPRILKSGETPAATYQQMWQTIMADREWRGEFHNRKKNGELFWESASISAILDDSGEIAHFVAVKEDITGVKRDREKLQQRESFLSAIAENQPGLLWLKDANGRVLMVNQSFSKACGRSDPAQVQGLTDFDLHPRDQAEKYRADDERVMAAGQPIVVEEKIVIGGKSVWHETFKAPVRDDQGRMIGTTGFALNITARKQAEQQLLEAFNFNHKIITDASVGIVAYKASGQCVLANEAAARTLNATVCQLLAQDFRKIPSWRTAGMLAAAEETLAAKAARHCEANFVGSFGKEIFLVCHFSPFVQNGEPHLLLIFTDVTEKKKLEAQFLRAQRMESIGTLAGGIAHDLNNVLAPLVIAIELLKDKINDAEGQNILAMLEANANRGSDLVRQVLAFGRGLRGERVVVQLKLIARNIQQIVQETFPKSVCLKTDIADDLWKVSGDATQIEQVLLNLCVNARDAMPSGGQLSLRLANATLDQAAAAGNLDAKPGRYVVITVTDAGEGMTQEVQDRIFEPFFTTKEHGKGTGLGLSTSLAIVNSHGGFIHCYSQPGKGTSFKVYLPAIVVPDAEPAAAEKPRLPRGHSELVLVVDDEEPIRNIATQILSRFDYRVLTAANGAEAVALYRNRGGDIAAVLTDMAMPVMDGTATIAALKAINPAVKIIGSSGLDSGVKVSAGLRHFIPKPYTAETLLNALRDVLHEKSAWGGNTNSLLSPASVLPRGASSLRAN